VADFQIHDAPQRTINPAHHRVFLRSISRYLYFKDNSLLKKAILRYIIYLRYLDSKRGTRPKRYWYLNPKVFYIRILRGLCDCYIRSRSFYLAKSLGK
jgi:hypothetical protein